MKKTLNLIFKMLFFISSSLFAQIYVGNNNFIFNKGYLIYSKSNISLQSNSILYLRNEAQILQGTTDISNNNGSGILSVYQEGTVNNFAYNYWCSPVGNPSNAVGNENFGISLLQIPTSNITSVPATILPMNNYNGNSSNGSLSIAPYWIWRFLSSSNYSQWLQSGANTNIAAGEGFTMKGTSGTDNTNIGEDQINNPGSAQRYDFRGKPNDGNISVNVLLNNFTLTGNPYPSALNVNAFLLDPLNTACTGIAYYWEQDKTVNSHILVSYKGGYGTYSPISLTSSGIYVPATFNTYTATGALNTIGVSSGLLIERKYAPIGQGFMVRGASNGAITLNNNHRLFYKESTRGSAHFEKNNVQSDTITDQVTPHIRINAAFNDVYSRQIALVFIDEATDSVDRGIDALSPAGADLDNDLYFIIENDKYVIQGTNFNINKRIKLGVKAKDNTSITFHFADLVNFDTNQNVFIYDALDNSYHNLKEQDYQVTIPIAGIFENRFEITFQDNALNTQAIVSNALVIIQNNIQHFLFVSNPNLLELKEINLFDISGRMIWKKNKLEIVANYQFPTSELSDGIYLVQIVTKDNIIQNQKVIISRNKN